MSLAVSQHLIDRRKNKLLVSLLREIEDHSELEKAWGLGPVHCMEWEAQRMWTPTRCRLIGLFKQQEYIFLGHSYEAALLRVNWSRDRAYAYDYSEDSDIEEYDFERYVPFRPDVSDALMNLEILSKIMPYFTD